ncbi:hypothetical protein ACXGQW_00840 [Wenyingzhuangia sp. IMCC45533]
MEKIDSSYINFKLNNKIVHYKVNHLSKIGLSRDSSYKNDSIRIGYNIYGKNTSNQGISLSLYYQISREHLRRDRYGHMTLNYFDFDTLIKTESMKYRFDYKNQLEGVEIWYTNDSIDNYRSNTNINDWYYDYGDVKEQIQSFNHNKSSFIIEKKERFCNGNFIITGKFESNIFNFETSLSDKITDGNFEILIQPYDNFRE